MEKGATTRYFGAEEIYALQQMEAQYRSLEDTVRMLRELKEIFETLTPEEQKEVGEVLERKGFDA